MSAAASAVVLRPAGRRDCATVLRIWREGSRAGHPFLTEADLDTQEAIIAERHLGVADITIAEVGEHRCGFIALLGGYVGALFVDPRWHGRGVGTALMQHVQAGAQQLELGVYEANARARMFYARMGFTSAGRTDADDEGRPHPVLHLRWSRSQG